MTNDENETARELINSAFRDLQHNKPLVRSMRDFAEMLACQLRDETELFTALLDAQEAALLSISVHEHGNYTDHDDQRQLASLSVEVLAKIRHDDSPLLPNLNNPKKHHAYAIALATTADDGDTALLLLLATRQGDQLLAIATNDADRNSSAWHADNDKEMPTDLRDTLHELAKAATR